MSRLSSWEVSDKFWEIAEPLIPKKKRVKGKKYKRKSGGGRLPILPRKVFEGIVYVLRTGIQWKALPKDKYGSPSAVHRYFLEWEKAGFFTKLWKKGLAEYDDFEGIAWKWQSGDGANIKAPMALESVGRNPTDRGKNGSKRSLLVDERGVPLSLIISGANRHDVTQLAALLESKVIQQKENDGKENLCLDAGYAGEAAKNIILDNGYVPHVRPRGEEIALKDKDPDFKPRRWIVEVAHSWFTRFRKLLVRYEKLDRSFMALHCLAAAIIALRKCGFIYG